MKKIIKYITFIAVALTVNVSCDWDDTEFDKLTTNPKEGSAVYTQFQDAAKSLETGVSESGDLVEIETTIQVALLGLPLKEDLPIKIILDPSTTISEDMYTLSANEITILAGETTGSITLTSIAENMPIDEELIFALTVDMGELNATAGTELVYKLKRINFCSWSVDDMIGTYTGTDSDPYYGGTVSGLKFEVFKVDDTHIAVSGICQSLYSVAWGESVTGGDRVVFEYKSNGGLTTENQFLVQTDNVWDYYFGPLGGQEIKWDGCNKIITIEYGFMWDDAYGDNMPALSVITKD